MNKQKKYPVLTKMTRKGSMLKALAKHMKVLKRKQGGK